MSSVQWRRDRAAQETGESSHRERRFAGSLEMKASRFILAAVIACAPPFASAQLQSYSKGQIVYPAYEGWEKNADGTFSMLFGYMNANWEEVFDVPVGPENRFEPGSPDQ